MRKENLYGWVFTYNPFQDVWLATTRDNYSNLFSNQKDDKVLRSKNIKTLEELVMRTNGDVNKIKNLVK